MSERGPGAEGMSVKTATYVEYGIIGLGIIKLKLRVKTGELNHTFQFMFVNHTFRHFQKIIEVQKVFKQRGVNEQSGINLAGGCGHQQVKLTV